MPNKRNKSWLRPLNFVLCLIALGAVSFLWNRSEISLLQNIDYNYVPFFNFNTNHTNDTNTPSLFKPFINLQSITPNTLQSKSSTNLSFDVSSTIDTNPNQTSQPSSDSSMSNNLQCDVQYNKSKISSYEHLITQCIHNYSTECSMQKAQNILFPNDLTNSISEKHIESIQNLKYLIVGHHGGVQMDIVSYLYYKLSIPKQNIYSYCNGIYCDILWDMPQAKQYWNENSQKIYNAITNLNRKHPDTGFGNCCFSYSEPILSNLSRTHLFQSFVKRAWNLSLPQIPNQKWDVLICSFPGIQCLGWLPFAKSIIIRFAHRYDHHVWNPKHARMKWTKILNMIVGNCRNKNIQIMVTNIYDYYYFKHSVNTNDKNTPQLWPNFAAHFIQDFAPQKSNFMPDFDGNGKNNFYIFSYTKYEEARDCREEYLNMTYLEKLWKTEHGINIIDNSTIYKPFMYNLSTVHTMINGFIVMPYAVHTAKWSELYSIGIPLFFPTLRLWDMLNMKCNVVNDRQYGNKPQKGLGISVDKEMYGWIKHSPCCKTNPYTNDWQNVWLPFSDHYNERLFKFLIFYDNQTDLQHKIIEHYDYLRRGDKERIWDDKQIQIKQWNDVSERFKEQIAGVIYKGYRASLFERADCIPYVINSSECISSMNLTVWD